MNRWPLFWLASILLVIPFGCSRKKVDVAPPQAPVVTVENPVFRDLDTLLEFTGYLAPTETQVVQSQVSGYLKQILFKDGDLVEPNQILYEIDPEPYQAALLNAVAVVAKSKADLETATKRLELAKSDWERAQRTAAGVLSPQEIDVYRTANETAAALRESAAAALQSAEAMLSKAQFDRNSCSIRNSISSPGRVGRSLITAGNLVVAGQTVLCEITSLDPIFAYWDVDEETSLRYRKQIFDLKAIPDPRGSTKLKFWVGLKDETRDANGKWPHTGFIDYLAPDIRRGSGTREIRGVLSNSNYRLSPGDSVRIQVTFNPTDKLLTIPEIAIGSQQQQKFVYCVVKKDGKQIAEMRPVKLGSVREVDGLRLQVIEAGLTPSDKVIVNGLLRVRPGIEVSPVESPMAAVGGEGR